MNRTAMIVVLVLVIVIAIAAVVWMVTHQGKTKPESFESKGGGEVGGSSSTGAPPMATQPQTADE